MKDLETEEMYECPNDCGNEIKESCKVCPHCEEDVVYCERGNHMVAKVDYDFEVSMCKDDYNDMVDRA